jgi:Tat protein translocase TatB subunit
MFDVGMQELLVVFVVALVFIGPRRLPEIARSLGKLMAELRRAGEELKGQIDLEAMMQEREESPGTRENPYGGEAAWRAQGSGAEAEPPGPDGTTQTDHAPVQEKDPEKTQA